MLASRVLVIDRGLCPDAGADALRTRTSGRETALRRAEPKALPGSGDRVDINRAGTDRPPAVRRPVGSRRRDGLSPPRRRARPPGGADVRDDPTAFVLGGSGGLRAARPAPCGTWVGIALVAGPRRHPAAWAVPVHRRDDGRGLHALLPRAHRPRRRPQRRLPAPLRTGIAARAHRLVRLFGHNLAAERTFGLLQHVGDHPRPVHAGPCLGAPRRHGRRRARRVLRADADRPDGDGVERRPRAHAVERGVRRPRRAPADECERASRRASERCPVAGAGLDRRRRPRRAGPDVPTGPRRRPRACSSVGRSGRGPTARLAVLLGGVVGLGADVGAPGDGRSGRRLPGHGRSTRCSTCGPGASCPGRRRGAASTVALQAVAEEIPPWWRLPAPPGVAHAVPVVLRDAVRRRRAARPGRRAAPAEAIDGPHDRRCSPWPRQRRHPPARRCSARTRPTCCG